MQPRVQPKPTKVSKATFLASAELGILLEKYIHAPLDSVVESLAGNEPLPACDLRIS